MRRSSNRPSYADRIRGFIASKTFFTLILIYFVINSLWLVFTALYPMAFDEDFHFRIIQIYAHHWLPYLSNQPPNALGLGSVYRDPSYFFHYLMSFPLRLIDVFTHNQTIQIICLRLLDVAFMTTALLVYRRALLLAKASRFATHVALALFVMIPIVPFLAATINYDNLMILLVGVAFLLSIKLLQSWPKGDWNSLGILRLILVLIVAGLVKYVTFPIILAIVVFLGWQLITQLRSGALQWRQLVIDLKNMRRWLLVTYVVLITVAAGLFVLRDGVNLVRYGTPIPKCEHVISVEECLNYGPWQRDYHLHQTKLVTFKPSPTYYVSEWVQGMWMRSLFAIASSSNGYENYPPLPIIGWLVWGFFGIGSLCCIVFARRILHGQTAVQFLLLATFAYCVALFIDGFESYAFTSVPVAINGRYLLPFLPIVFVVYGRAIGATLRTVRIPKALSWCAVLVLAAFLLQGGGAVSWIVRSRPFWDWPNHTVRSANTAVKNVLRPITFGA